MPHVKPPYTDPAVTPPLIDTPLDNQSSSNTPEMQYTARLFDHSLTSRQNRSAPASKSAISASTHFAATDQAAINPQQTPPTVALAIRGIYKYFQNFIALKDIHLELHAGELLCFLGPSGCGKTTLLRLIAGLDTIDQGQILKNGIDISHMKTEKRRCGIVFQNYALFPNLTVTENIAYGLIGEQWRKAARQARVSELLTLIGLTGSEQKYPLQLSGGQQQRVALARAIAPQPDILLLDEPLSALDARVRLRLRQEIRVLQQRLHMPTILVTHDQEEALTLADRIVVMNHGVIEQIGSPEAIYHQPSSRFVASFVGQMNFLPAQILSSHTLLIAGQYRLTLTKALNLPSGTNNHAVEIGFRPEAARLTLSSEQTEPSVANVMLPALLVSKEFLGAQTRVHLSVQSITADDKSPSVHAIQIDSAHDHSVHQLIQHETLSISIHESQLHVFDQTGQALC